MTKYQQAIEKAKKYQNDWDLQLLEAMNEKKLTEAEKQLIDDIINN